MAEVTITARPNGPLIVEGETKLLDSKGNPFPAQNRVALCRCGGSANKPFCDGAHGRTGFKSEVSAPGPQKP
jgi:CDGSH-type Zn-finger protein